MIVYKHVSLFFIFNLKRVFLKNGHFSTSAENKILTVALIALKLTGKGYQCNMHVPTNKNGIWKFLIVLLFTDFFIKNTPCCELMAIFSYVLPQILRYW